MEELKVQFNEIYKPSTSRTYINSLTSIFKKLGIEGIPKGKISSWFKMGEFYKNIENLKPSTQRNQISAVIALLKVKKESGKMFDDLSERRDLLNNTYLENAEAGKSESEKGNWPSEGELKGLYDHEVKKYLNSFNLLSSKGRKLKSENLTSPQKRQIKEYVIIATFLFPFSDIKNNKSGVLRNDISTLRLAKGGKVPQNGENYLNLKPGGKSSIVLRNHKTDKSAGPKEIALDAEIATILKNYVAMFSIKNEEKLFDLSKHDVTNILIKFTKKHLGKNIGSQMLRKAFLTSRYGKSKAESEAEKKKELDREELASNMGHSVEVGDAVYIKTKDDSPKIVDPPRKVRVKKVKKEK
jgi:hypothetical protein